MNKQAAVDALYDEIESCTLCPRLVETRTKVVRGRGDADRSQILILGEVPRETEDRFGTAFQGPAGHKLNGLLAAVTGARDDDFFIDNAVRCRPTLFDATKDRVVNAPPTTEEVKNCKGYLHRLIRIIDPVCIVVAGKIACDALGIRGAITKVAGKMVDVVIPGAEGPITYCTMPIVHPAFLLRTEDKPQYEINTVRALNAVVARVTALFRVHAGLPPVDVSLE